MRFRVLFPLHARSVLAGTGRRTYGGSSAVLVVAGRGDIERQHLIGVPGSGKLLQGRDLGDAEAVQLVDGRRDRNTDRALKRALEDGLLGEGGIGQELELGPDVVGVSYEPGDYLPSFDNLSSIDYYRRYVARRRLFRPAAGGDQCYPSITH
jgi:hypothetical protein